MQTISLVYIYYDSSKLCLLSVFIIMMMMMMYQCCCCCWNNNNLIQFQFNRTYRNNRYNKSVKDHFERKFPSRSSRRFIHFIRATDNDTATLQYFDFLSSQILGLLAKATQQREIPCIAWAGDVYRRRRMSFIRRLLHLIFCRAGTYV